MSDNDKLLQDLYRRAIAVCHPDRAPTHLHSSMEAKTKELTAAYRTGDFARVREIALELGVKKVPPMPKAEPVPKPSQPKQRAQEEVSPLGDSLHLAAVNGHAEVVKLLLSAGANPNAVGNDGETALYLAAVNGHAEVVKLLLSAGANPNAVGNDGETALYLAAVNRYAEVVKLLLSAGANPNAVGNDGETALMSAALDGHSEIVAILREAGAK